MLYRGEMALQWRFEMKIILDRIARALGYFTSDDVAACVKSAELEAINDAKKSTMLSGSDVPPLNSEILSSDLIRYFVSYNFGTQYGRSGFGCIEIERSESISSHDDILKIVNLIVVRLESSGVENPAVVILNWQRFELPGQNDGGRESMDADKKPVGVLRLVA